MEKIRNESTNRRRKRVPISCLNCKKRKVKCDKVKPACGGCVKNGVGDLCQYIEPEWARNSPTKEVDHVIPNNGLGTMEETQNDERSRSDNFRVIYDQAKEIEKLKRKLAVYEKNGGVTYKYFKEQSFLTVLNKLCSPNKGSKGTLEVENDEELTIIKDRSNQGVVDFYSWVGVIKMDPQLTMMWYRITGLQQIYHMYKINLANRSLPKGRKYESDHASLNRSSHQDKEIDFTQSFSLTSNVSLLRKSKCPVVQCDFNFMNDGSSGDASQRASAEPVERSSFRPYRGGRLSESRINAFSYSQLTRRLQDLWDSILELGKSNEKMTSNQLTFLFDSYFERNVMPSTTTKTLNLYKDKITKIYKSVANNLFFSLSYSSNDFIDGDSNKSKLCTNGVYLCMLATIIEESLEYFRAQLKDGYNDANNDAFIELFPNEVACLRLSFPPSSIVTLISEILLSIYQLFSIKSKPTLSFMTSCTISMNHIINYVDKYGISKEVKENFAGIFEIFLSILMDERSQSNLWKFHEKTVKNPSGKSFDSRLKMNLAYLWNQSIHIVNICTMKLTPLLIMDEDVCIIMEKFYLSLDENALEHQHYEFLENLPNERHRDLKEHLPKQNFIALLHKQLFVSIKATGSQRLTTDRVLKLKNDCREWSKHVSKFDTDLKSQFEATFVFNYLEIFLSYLLLLQDEEDEKDGESLVDGIADLIYDCSKFVLDLQYAIIDANKKYESQYLLLGATELLTKTIQIIVGLLLKSRLGKIVKIERKLNRELRSKFKNLSDKVKDVEGIVKETLVKNVEETIKLLNNSSLTDKNRSSKLERLWNFYMTLLNNLSKQSGVSYASIHSNIPVFRCEDITHAHECPIPLSSRSQLMDSSMKEKDFKKCPISHLTSPINEKDEETPSQETAGCPFKDVNAENVPVLSDTHDNARLSGSISKRRKLLTDPRTSAEGRVAIPRDISIQKSTTSKCPFHNATEKETGDKFNELSNSGYASSGLEFQDEQIDPARNMLPKSPDNAPKTPMKSEIDLMGPLSSQNLTNDSPQARRNVYANQVNGMDLQNLDDFANYDLEFLQHEDFFESINNMDSFGAGFFS